MSRALFGWIAALASLPLAAQTEEEELPDLDFLEYLGSWQDQDEEWFVEAEIADPEQERRAKRKREADDSH